MKWFIIVVDETTVRQRNRFTKFVEDTGSEVWHWMEPAWIIVDKRRNASASNWVKDATSSFPATSRVFVADFSDRPWSAFSPPESVDWLKQFLKGADEPG